MENRLLRQDERFMREIADLRETVKNRVESLENFMKSETASIMHRLQEEKAERAAAFKNDQHERGEALKAEHKDRVDAMKQDRRERDDALAKAARDVAKAGEAFERKLAAFSATMDAVEQELRQLLLAESSRLSAATEEKYKDALAAIGRTSAQLQNNLVSRSNLSATFTEFAVRLAGDLSLSGRTGKPGGPDASGNAGIVET